MADILERPTRAPFRVCKTCADTLQILGWGGLIKIDGLTYSWLGIPGVGIASNWTKTEVTPTRTILTVQAGPVSLNVTFLSPVEVRRILFITICAKV